MCEKKENDDAFQSKSYMCRLHIITDTAVSYGLCNQLGHKFMDFV